MTKLTQQKFSAGQVAAIVGVSPTIINSWCNLGHIVGHKTLGKGHRREFTFYNLMEIAGAVALMEIGLTSPADAFRASAQFAHFGDGHLPGLPHRAEEGETFLAISGQLSNVLLAEKGEINTRRAFPMHRKLAGLILLNVTEVFKAVVAKMDTGSTWVQILNEEYGH